MKSVNRQHTAPVQVSRSNRNHGIAVLTSLPAGKCVPIAAIPMLREDSLRGRMRVAVEMQETKELLMNPVNLRVTAHVVPLLALERFEGSRDQFDRSYMGQPQVEGGSVVPFIETHAMGTHGSNAVYKALGLHAGETDQVNTMYLEAYNAVWNFRARNRSPRITERLRLDSTLAPAFWRHSRFEHVVPDVDLAVIDGEVALNVVSQALPVKGIGWNGSPTTTVAASFRDSTGTRSNVTVNDPSVAPVVAEVATGFPAVYAEMIENGITVSLSNLELARKTQAFAKLRERYQEHDEEWIIDMLMNGLSIPDQALKQPILIADKTARFAQVKRYATDAANLAESAVSGGAIVDLNLRVPKLETGGVVVVMAECLPEQLFERQRDPLFFASNTRDPNGELADFPAFLRDFLDPEKVEVVVNGEIDTAHSSASTTFGYAPLNWRWNAFGPRVGGKFYRPTTDGATDTDRQRLWAVETVDPVLGEDFYLVSGIHSKPFLDTTSDPFEATAVGNLVLNGNTQFGAMLVEPGATSNYDEVAEKAPTDRIVKEA